MYKSFCFLILILFCSFRLTAQETNPEVSGNEHVLQGLFLKLHQAATDEGKDSINGNILKLMNQTLLKSGSFSWPFDSLKTMGKLTSSDNQVRLYTWNIPFSDNTYKYFGFIQYFSSRQKKYLIYPLIDKSAEITNPEYAPLTNNRWFGSLYYEIIPVKYKSDRYYTLLALDYNNLFTSKKIVDVLYFDKSDFPHFGAAIFQVNNQLKDRIIFEFSARAIMTLHFDNDLKMITFDHLSPAESKYTGNYEYYGPDFSYDGLKFKKGRWSLVPDIPVRNAK
ncbi:MAG: hypothetical protein Q8907_10525 [Bacteroidota bacterium]|nr:hypothetical protein [Bacteroidota bacterium]